MQKLISYADVLNARGYKNNITKVSEEIKETKDRVRQMCNNGIFTNTELQDFKILWADVKSYLSVCVMRDFLQIDVVIY